jgi:hypothetical protein
MDRVAVVRRLLQNGWIRVMVIDPETGGIHIHSRGQWHEQPGPALAGNMTDDEAIAL